MAHYLIAFTNGGLFDGKSIVHLDGTPRSEDASHTYNTHWLNQSEAARTGNTEVYSGGWLNFSAGIAFMPEEKIGVVVLANAYPAQWLPVKDASAIAFDVLRLYTGNLPEPETQTLLGRYLFVDAGLLLAAGFLIWRGLGLVQQSSRREEYLSGSNLVGIIIFDLVLPLAILVFLPVIFLGEIDIIEPIRYWNRLLFQIPDITSAIMVIAAAGFGIGVLKIRKFHLLEASQQRI
jgi:hypothetical protein